MGPAVKNLSRSHADAHCDLGGHRGGVRTPANAICTEK
jgi:hypothetical protein